MSKEQALKILEEVTAQLKLSRPEHMTVLQALAVLGDKWPTMPTEQK